MSGSATGPHEWAVPPGCGGQDGEGGVRVPAVRVHAIVPRDIAWMMLAGLIAGGHLGVPIANVYPLAQVREAYTELERRHTCGKIVLRP
jgi:NADPH:quinone reductase-like Zn-dependent oxidoreductase